LASSGGVQRHSPAVVERWQFRVNNSTPELLCVEMAEPQNPTLAKAEPRAMPIQPDLAACNARVGGFADYVDGLSEDASCSVRALNFGNF
jgi:hypothetical protein